MKEYIITMIDGTTKVLKANEIDEFIKENSEQIRGIDVKGE